MGTFDGNPAGCDTGGGPPGLAIPEGGPDRDIGEGPRWGTP